MNIEQRTAVETVQLYAQQFALEVPEWGKCVIRRRTAYSQRGWSCPFNTATGGRGKPTHRPVRTGTATVTRGVKASNHFRARRSL